MSVADLLDSPWLQLLLWSAAAFVILWLVPLDDEEKR